MTTWPFQAVWLFVGLLISIFRFISKATLADLVIYFMYYMLDFPTYRLLWRAKSKFHKFPLYHFFSLFLSLWLVRFIHARSNQSGVNGPRRTKGAGVSERHPHSGCIRSAFVLKKPAWNNNARAHPWWHLLLRRSSAIRSR